MAVFSVDTDSIIASSKQIAELAEELQNIRNRLDGIPLSGAIEGQYRAQIDQVLNDLLRDVTDEAAKMNTLGSALNLIAVRYKDAEEAILSNLTSKSDGTYVDNNLNQAGTDKRKWWQKFWGWITRKEPDDYKTTSSEQEKAADAAMKKKLWEVLQDEKYSPENWDKSSVEERKKILQDYMNEVIAIYGLKDVKTKIRWDNNATYTEGSITWGYYTHGTHSVTLNERALTDSVGGWDSYDLLETVSHELRHAYQHEAIDHPTDFMVSKETIDSWNDNFKHYISSSTDYQGYRDQAVERDARDFQVNRNDNY